MAVLSQLNNVTVRISERPDGSMAIMFERGRDAWGVDAQVGVDFNAVLRKLNQHHAAISDPISVPFKYND